MGLTMSLQQAVTKAFATRYRRARPVEKSTILDELAKADGRTATSGPTAMRPAPAVYPAATTSPVTSSNDSVALSGDPVTTSGLR